MRVSVSADVPLYNASGHTDKHLVCVTVCGYQLCFCPIHSGHEPALYSTFHLLDIHHQDHLWHSATCFLNSTQ